MMLCHGKIKTVSDIIYYSMCKYSFIPLFGYISPGVLTPPLLPSPTRTSYVSSKLRTTTLHDFYYIHMALGQRVYTTMYIQACAFQI